MSATVLKPVDGRARVSSPEEFLEWLLGLEGMVACDTETAGFAWDDEVRLVQFGTGDAGYAISAQDRDGRTLVQEAVRAYRGQLVFHNAGFDIRRLQQIGVNPDYVWPRALDTHTMSHIIDPGAIHKLKMLGARLLDEDAFDEQVDLKARMAGKKWVWDAKKEKWAWRKQKGRRVFTFADVPLLMEAPYGVKDTELTYRLAEYFLPQLDTVEYEVMARETEVSTAMFQVSTKGMRLDQGYAHDLKRRWEADLEFYREKFREEYGVTNPNADAQLIAALKAQGWEPKQFAAKGLISEVNPLTGEVVKVPKPVLDKSVLTTLVDKYPMVADLKEYKRTNKWLEAYVINCLEQMDHEGRVHASYNPLGARTGRMSCSNPPLQQLPKGGGGEVRRLFIASEGNVIASVDYSAIEMRLAASFSQDPHLLAVYEAGGDVYQDMADRIGCTRPQAKIVCLAALYGSRGKSIAKAIGTTQAEAVAIVARFWDEYPTLSRWAKSIENESRTKGIYSLWGRRLSPERPYAAPNYKIQGTAAEVMKDGILRLGEERLLRHVVAVVHDEVVLDVPENDAEFITAQVAKVLQDDRFLVPLTAEGEVYGASWGDGYAA